MYEERRIFQLEIKVRQLEAQVQGLLAHLGIDPAAFTPQEPPEIQAARQILQTSGHKIEAIKVYREYTGVGLKEAKDVIDELAAHIRTYGY